MKSKKGTIPGWMIALIMAVVFLIIAALLTLVFKEQGIALLAHIKSIVRLV